MKKTLFALSLLFTICFGCQSNSSNETVSDSVTLDTNITSNSSQSCYQYIKDKDTATLMLMTSGTITTGELSIKLWEKDKNEGKIIGELRGDTILADYTFNSEGMTSTRQVAFLKKGNQLLEGYGESEEKNGQTKFKNTSSLVFGKGIVFSKEDCK